MASANWMMKERILVHGEVYVLVTDGGGEAEIRITFISEIAAEGIWVGGLIILHLMKQKDLKKKKGDFSYFKLSYILTH